MNGESYHVPRLPAITPVVILSLGENQGSVTTRHGRAASEQLCLPLSWVDFAFERNPILRNQVTNLFNLLFGSALVRQYCWYFLRVNRDIKIPSAARRSLHLFSSLETIKLVSKLHECRAKVERYYFVILFCLFFR